jgi:hypothetical protein
MLSHTPYLSHLLAAYIQNAKKGAKNVANATGSRKSVLQNRVFSDLVSGFCSDFLKKSTKRQKTWEDASRECARPAVQVCGVQAPVGVVEEEW